MAITLDILKTLLEEQKKDIFKNINDASERVMKNTDEKVGVLSEKIEKLEQIVETQGLIIEKQEAYCAKHERQITQLELTVRKNNIIIFKVEENERTTEELLLLIIDLINKSNEQFDLIKNDIESCFRLGKKTEGKIRPIRITFKSYEKKQKVLMGKKSGATFTIAEDLPKSVVEARKPLIPKLLELKKEGKRAHFKLDELVVEGKIWKENSPETSKKRSRSNENSPSGQPKNKEISTNKTKTTIIGSTDINPKRQQINPIMKFLTQQNTNELVERENSARNKKQCSSSYNELTYNK